MVGVEGGEVGGSPRVELVAQRLRLLSSEVDEDFEPMPARTDEAAQRVAAFVRQPAVRFQLFGRHLVAVERDDVLVGREAVGEPFGGVGGGDGTVGQLLLHAVGFGSVAVGYGVAQPLDAFAVGVATDKFKLLLNADETGYE